ncbi:DUF4303 domain-containing protein [Paenibacillus ginsengarvi]|uniref:DUF4303 domain-containing protein n=1 Tax=Paenibacillus ginsengarvi TaxID=400777 RepID=A0A3B0AWF3_9BACL|nr:DUF4303 domain-containing protein [Paenibacillus ginsengarvi]RKN64900.1 DUF4303 domain-containing protein [Paenibacillus ginsengarvi]
MYTYYSKLGRMIEGKTPLSQEGYYVLSEENCVTYSSVKPESAELITVDRFTEALVQGCKSIIHSFANGPDNKEVYVFNLNADEHSSIFIYMNTIPRFEETLAGYRSRYGEKYNDFGEINSLKYNQGDFDFQFWPEGEPGRIVEAFETIAYGADDADDAEQADFDEEEDKPVFAFEAGVIRDGYYAIALKAVRLLIEENAFAPLNKTENFIVFASTGNDYLDYGTVMRKTIAPELLYGVFPDLREKDRQFEQELDQIRHLPISDYLNHWIPAVHSSYTSVSPYLYDKSEYDIFLQLERFGNELAQECLNRLEQLDYGRELSREESDLLYYYAEALHFSGELTREQKEQCLELARMMGQAEDDLADISKEMAEIASKS